MSIGSLGIVGSLAGSPLAQKAPEADKVQKDATDRTRQSDAEARAESAAGIGQTEEESQASDRDADGRRPWEVTQRKKEDEPATEPSPDGSVLAVKDPSGDRGSLIDISG
ncbi:MAG TPA: hypothetical protein VMP01_10170 [Pirellulaceae bacterium]|nr:hypothetical protein [Pirellulaceae bacterium]